VFLKGALSNGAALQKFASGSGEFGGGNVVGAGGGG